METLEADLRGISERHKDFCLWFSGGADSLLILQVLLKIKVKFGVLRFDDGLTRKQKAFGDAVIIKEKLQVFSYAALGHLMVGEGENIALVSDYAIDKESRVPLLRDLVDGDKCAFDLPLSVAHRADAPIKFDAHIWGTRREDVHPVIGVAASGSEWIVGGKQFYAPLFDWQRYEAIEALKDFGIDYAEPPDAENSGNIQCCFECIKGKETFCPKVGAMIPPHEWDAEGNTAKFRQAVGFR